MIDPALLRVAVERGIVSDRQAEALAALARETPPVGSPFRRPPIDDENVRFVSGFGDVFVTIGLALFLGSVGYFAGLAGGPAARWGGVAILSWALAEFFTRRRHMALPSIALLVAFAATAFMTLSYLLGGATRAYQPGRGWLVNTIGLDLGSPIYVALAAFVTAGLIGLHFVRFRVPVSIAAATAALAGGALALIAWLAPSLVRDHLNPLLLACGLALFALAMRFDLADPDRTTRRTDAAFWLHLAAAPLIVHPLVAPLIRGDQARDLAAAGIVLALFLALGLVALVIDRRAMLVSGLTYAGVAIGTLIARSGLGIDRIIPATLLGLGAFVLLVSAGWQPMRAIVLRALPSSLARRLAPVRRVPLSPAAST